ALAVLSSFGPRYGQWSLPGGTIRRLERLSRQESSFVRWALCAVSQWRPSPGANRVRVFQIHGECDRVLPVSRSKADVVVPGGAHALTLFNPTAVNAFIADVVRSVA
ncbi:MAG TPA: hypothetical protein VLM40_09325, partial [Gemmata sp.]|nr:hypothetical protein [Gemmata sp.]